MQRRVWQIGVQLQIRTSGWIDQTDQQLLQ